MKRVAFLAAVAVLLAATLARAEMKPGGSVRGAIFSVLCPLSHSAPDDPIVFPGQPGASHMHNFLGNDSTDAYSTNATIMAATTTCAVSLDRSAYWIPELRTSQGVPILPKTALIYYRNGTGGSQTFPADFRLVTPRAYAAPAGEIGWGCGNDEPYTTTIPNCTGLESIRAHIEFQSCWDGTAVNHVDDSAHLAYAGPATARTCPAGFPIRLPRIEINVRYEGGPKTCVGCTLSSGAPDTLHADFLNGWDATVLAHLVDNLNIGTTCNLLVDGDPCLTT